MICVRCDRVREDSFFRKSAKSPEGRLPWCKDCTVAKGWVNPMSNRVPPEERWWAGRLWQSHKIRVPVFKMMASRFDGACWVCRCRPLEGRLLVEHDWECCPQGRESCGECIRGLVCKSCRYGSWTIQRGNRMPSSFRFLFEAYLDEVAIEGINLGGVSYGWGERQGALPG